MILLASLGCGRDLPESTPAPDSDDTPAQSAAANETSGSPTDPATPGSEDEGPAAPPPEQDMAITIARMGGLGYCMAEGMVLSGGVSTPDALFQGTRVVAGDLGRGDCLDPWMESWSICDVAEDFGPVPLGPDQLAELNERAAAVPQYSCDPYDGMVCDPCLITTITIGDRTLTDFCCGTMKARYWKTFSALASYLDELAAPVQ
jgi:hypothetical protein